MLSRHVLLCLLVLCLGVTGNAGKAQDRDLQAVQTQAEAALAAGDPAAAAAGATELITARPDGFAGWFILALARSDERRHEDAATAAARAYDLAPDRLARFQTARLAARAHLSLNQFFRAEFWLRRAANHADDEADLAGLLREYALATAANPLTIDLTAAIIPSNNINGGSDDGILRFEGIDLTFYLPEYRRALSGIGYEASVDLSYRLLQSDRQRTTVTAHFFGQTYSLSPDARETLDSSPNPDVQALRGRDFGSRVAEIGLQHQRRDLSPLGPVNFGLELGTYWEGTERLVTYRDYTLEQATIAGPDATFNLTARLRDQQALVPGLIDTKTYDLIGAINVKRPSGNRLQFSLAGREHIAGPETSYEEYRLGVGYGFDEPFLGMRLSSSATIGYRSYEEFVTTLDGRRDRFAAVSTTAVFDDIRYFGFSPSATIRFDRTFSSAEEYTSTGVSFRVGIESRF